MTSQRPAQQQGWAAPTRSSSTKRGFETPTSGRDTPSGMQQPGASVQLFSTVAGHTVPGQHVTEIFPITDARHHDEVLSHRLSEAGNASQAQDSERNNLTAQITRTLEQQVDRAGNQNGSSLPENHKGQVPAPRSSCRSLWFKPCQTLLRPGCGWLISCSDASLRLCM